MRALEPTVTHILTALRRFFDTGHMGTCRVRQCSSVQHSFDALLTAFASVRSQEPTAEQRND